MPLCLRLQPSSQQSRASLQPWEEPLVTCTGCSLVLVLPIPSTVVTATWCKEQMGARQALAEKWLEPQIKVIPLTIQAIRADPSAGSERFVMLRVTSPHSTLCSLFHRDPHLSTRARARAPPLSCGGTHWCTLGLWAGAWKPGALSAASYSGRSWRLSKEEASGRSQV